MAEVCHWCRRPELNLFRQGDGRLACGTCMGDVARGDKPGFTVARRSPAVQIPCPTCMAMPGRVCVGVARFIHVQRRLLAAELLALRTATIQERP
jgi:hypothetical protein